MSKPKYNDKNQWTEKSRLHFIGLTEKLERIKNWMKELLEKIVLFFFF